jgi:hypothetical protein
MNVFNRLLQRQDDNAHLLIVETIHTLVEEYGDQIMQIEDDPNTGLPIKSRWYALSRLLVCMVIYRVPDLSNNPMAIALSSQRPISGKLLLAVCEALAKLVTRSWEHVEIVECIAPIVLFLFGAIISSEKTSSLVSGSLLAPIKRIADSLHRGRERLKDSDLSLTVQSFAISILQSLKYELNY